MHRIGSRQRPRLDVRTPPSRRARARRSAPHRAAHKAGHEAAPSDTNCPSLVGRWQRPGSPKRDVTPQGTPPRPASLTANTSSVWLSNTCRRWPMLRQSCSATCARRRKPAASSGNSGTAIRARHVEEAGTKHGCSNGAQRVRNPPGKLAADTLARRRGATLQRPIRRCSRARALTVLSAEPVARMLGLLGLKARQLTSARCASLATITAASRAHTHTHTMQGQAAVGAGVAAPVARWRGRNRDAVVGVVRGDAVVGVGPPVQGVRKGRACERGAHRWRAAGACPTG